ncbi:DUF3592 domain-containing protein [Prauserella cavernicola]|uniref:DUF3592 domain-containing protein n=1 Tax=Prauserella cavernicola TaxID=2800127 RepID=A0A934V3C1_9PSEU|nr:DUF3592 domain-containing protein [Prauserella cavernicola]MBK1784167.1 hypothetical protein [Prauserella cavernicola]
MGVPNERALRIGGWVVLGVAGVITLLCATLVFGSLRGDRAIAANHGVATAQVDQVFFDRTIIRFETPDGVAHSPSNGVLYPDGLAAGQLVRIEYDTTNPDLAKVAGRTWLLTLLPTGMMVLITWAIAGPLLWWLRSRRRKAAEQPAAAEPESQPQPKP